MRHTRKSSLFLIELIIAILFFSLSAAVCVQLFSSAYLTTREINYRDTAILQAQSIAELFRNEDGEMTAVVETYDATLEAEGEYICYIEYGGETYQVEMQVTGEDNLPRLDIQVIPPNSTEAIIELSTQVYVQLDKEGE